MHVKGLEMEIGRLSCVPPHHSWNTQARCPCAIEKKRCLKGYLCSNACNWFCWIKNLHDFPPVIFPPGHPYDNDMSAGCRKGNDCIGHVCWFSRLGIYSLHDRGPCIRYALDITSLHYAVIT